MTVAGLLLAPSAVGQLVAGPVAGRLGVRTGFRATLVIGSLLNVAAFSLLAVLHDAWWHLALGGLLLGAGVAFAFASMANLIVAAVEQREVGIATGINTVTRTIGGAFGSAVSTAVLASTADGGRPAERRRLPRRLRAGCRDGAAGSGVRAARPAGGIRAAVLSGTPRAEVWCAGRRTP